jgi:hypothetical protein
MHTSVSSIFVTPNPEILHHICPMCSRFSEDGGHLFLNCKLVHALWRELNLDHIRTKLKSCFDAKNVVAQILNTPDQEKLKCVALLSVW